MKSTKNASKNASNRSNAVSTLHPSLGASFSADPVAFSDLVHRAAEGDTRAIGVIAIGMGPALLACARSVVQHREDAEDLLQDFYEILLTGRAARFPPKPGRGLDWLEGLMRSMARVRREERATDWGLGDPTSARRTSDGARIPRGRMSAPPPSEPRPTPSTARRCLDQSLRGWSGRPPLRVWTRTR